MFRYVAIIWNEKNDANTSTAERTLKRLNEVSRDLRVVFTCPGMTVLSNSSAKVPVGPCHLWSNCGVILGTVFRTPNSAEDDDGTRLAALQAHETSLVVATGGRHLVEKYWGRYVAFINDFRNATKLIVRDPMGGLPCYIHELHGITVAFSSLTDCLRTGLFQFTLNWRHIAARIALGSMPLNETGLEGCAELYPGSCFRISGGDSAQIELWQPMAAAVREPLEDLDTAASNLRRVVLNCMNAWASSHSNALLDISGGLDSAIVAACLAQSPAKPKITGLKFNAMARPEETQRARLVADRAGHELVEIEIQRQPLGIERILAADPTANMQLNFGVVESLDARMHLAHERGATGIFNGDPGDVLFGISTKEYGLRDYLYRHGLDTRALKIALDVALMTNRSWWSVLADGLRRSDSGTVSELPKLVMAYRQLPADSARQVVAQHSELYRPRNLGTAGVPPGTSEFLFPFSRGAPYYYPLRAASGLGNWDPEPVYVLRSQPLVELCLRIPPYIKNANARERCVARHAFRNDVPHEIISTLWKDPAPGAAHDRLLFSMPSIREFMLDGILVKEKMLDGRKLQDALSTGAVRRTSDSSELYDHFMAELWLRRMTAALQEIHPTTWRAAARA